MIYEKEGEKISLLLLLFYILYIINLEKLTDPLSELAGAAEIDDFDGWSFGVAEENVLGFEIAVDDAQFGRREEEQGRAELLGKLASQVQRHAAEVRVA